jgi:hypothetical protein
MTVDLQVDVNTKSVEPSTSLLQGVGHEEHYSDAQLQWLIELCGCHADGIHAQHLVLYLYLAQPL